MGSARLNSGCTSFDNGFTHTGWKAHVFLGETELLLQRTFCGGFALYHTVCCVVMFDVRVGLGVPHHVVDAVQDAIEHIRSAAPPNQQLHSRGISQDETAFLYFCCSLLDHHSNELKKMRSNRDLTEGGQTMTEDYAMTHASSSGH